MASRARPGGGNLPEYRVVVMGGDGSGAVRCGASDAAGVGKSALTAQFVHARFVDEYDPTIGESYRKTCTVDDERAVLVVLDTAGQEDHSAARDGCLQQGDGFVLVFALNSRGSLQVLAHLQQQILQVKDADTFPMLVVGNKSDLDAERQVSSAEGREVARAFGCRYVETSAKLRHNVEEVFYGIVRDVRAHRRPHASDSKPARCDIV